jgi:glycosyltransferase involved in cell wall biosynthesis
MTELPDLVLLTANYPFGHRNEPFLETEAEVLASRFGRLYVLPSHREPGLRPLPPRAELVEMPWLTPASRRQKRRALASPEARQVLGITAGRGAELRSLASQWRRHLDLLAQNVLKLGPLADFARAQGLREAIFYDYWFENTTLALSMLRRSGQIRTAVARAHRFDLYDLRRGQVAFRTAKARGLDALLAVSDHGAAYLRERLPGLGDRISVHRLGVADPGALSPPAQERSPLIVSCAFLRPAKRIHLIPEVLARLPGPVRWVHFGEGPERGRVEEAARRLPGRISWSLAGHAEREEILRFYREQPVSALLSVSSSEGLPVSMMEAQSHGIPIVACDVGGVAEIVTPIAGLLVGPADPVPELAAALSAALQPGRFPRTVIHGNFQANFNASVNYNRLADALIALHGSEAASDRPGVGAPLAAESHRP